MHATNNNLYVLILYEGNNKAYLLRPYTQKKKQLDMRREEIGHTKRGKWIHSTLVLGKGKCYLQVRGNIYEIITEVFSPRQLLSFILSVILSRIETYGETRTEKEKEIF